jgi:hypothetical protein
MAIAYSTSGPSMFPSIRYAGRLAADPLNDLGQGEAVMPLAMQFACSCVTVLEKSVEWNGATIESFDLVLIATQPFIGPLSRTC